MAARAGSTTDRSSFVLASASPRRRWLLEKLGVRFEVVPVAIEERPRRDEAPRAFAQRMADEKAGAAAHLRPGSWVLAADTVVALDDVILGKPCDAADAARMLALLAGRVHWVLTGVTLLGADGAPAERAVIATEVAFRALDDAEVRAYVATGEPLDKAGAYGIQGEGAHLVDRVDGSYTNVIGLPLAEVAAWLRAWRIG